MVVLKDLPGQQYASQPTRANMVRGRFSGDLDVTHD